MKTFTKYKNSDRPETAGLDMASTRSHKIEANLKILKKPICVHLQSRTGRTFLEGWKNDKELQDL